MEQASDLASQSIIKESALSASRLLENKVAILSGVGEGLGRDTALLFAQHGADLVITARKTDVIERVAAEVREAGSKCESAICDVMDAAACRAVSQLATDTFGAIDVLVNIAYRSDYPAGYVRVADTDDELTAFRNALEVNLVGTLKMTKAVLPAMKARGGYIVMVNTMMAAMTAEGVGSYSASKAALEKASKSLALEVGQFGIRVNSMHPGYMSGPQTEFVFEQRAAENGTTAEFERRQVSDTIPLKYIPSTAEHAKAILFLASDLASAITGQSLHVNGGLWRH